MQHDTLTDFVTHARKSPPKGPVAIVIVEDNVEIASTLGHLHKQGFKTLLAVAPATCSFPDDLPADLHRITHNTTGPEAAPRIVNTLIPALQNQWVHYCYNAEYLFFPFCETRSIAEMLSFHGEERRSAMVTFVIDLYATDLGVNPLAVSLETAQLDKTGYYALARADAATGGHRDRQLDFYGGLRWRFEEHIPKQRRKIDRIGLFKSKAGLQLRPDHTFNDEEYNTYACPWHHNLTAAICSFRTAKALKRNPGSSASIQSFTWHNSAPFEWHSKQLLDLGLIEPGQWF